MKTIVRLSLVMLSIITILPLIRCDSNDTIKTVTFKDGSKYTGQMKNSMKHGFGKYTWADGRQYIGYWDNGKQHGLGKYILEGGFQIGRWVKGKRSTWLTEEEIDELKDEPAFARILKTN